MALQKTINTSQGVEAGYWRLGIVNHHPINNSCQVVLYPYVSKAARDAGAAPFVDQRVELSIPCDAIGDGSLTEVYGAIKQQEGWTDAVDC